MESRAGINRRTKEKVEKYKPTNMLGDFAHIYISLMKCRLVSKLSKLCNNLDANGGTESNGFINHQQCMPPTTSNISWSAARNRNLTGYVSVNRISQTKLSRLAKIRNRLK